MIQKKAPGRSRGGQGLFKGGFSKKCRGGDWRDNLDAVPDRGSAKKKNEGGKGGLTGHAREGPQRKKGFPRLRFWVQKEKVGSQKPTVKKGRSGH